MSSRKKQQITGGKRMSACRHTCCRLCVLFKSQWFTWWRLNQANKRAPASCNLNQPLAGDKRISLWTSTAKTQSKLQCNSTLLKQQRLAERPAGGLQPERRGEAIQTQPPQPPSQRWTQTNLRTTTLHLSAARKRGNRRQDVRLLLRRVKRYNYNLWNNMSRSVAETSGSLRFSQAGGLGPESYSRMYVPFASHSRSSQPQSSPQAAKKEMDSVKAVNLKKHAKVKKQRIVNWRGCGSKR